MIDTIFWEGFAIKIHENHVNVAYTGNSYGMLKVKLWQKKTEDDFDAVILVSQSITLWYPEWCKDIHVRKCKR